MKLNDKAEIYVYDGAGIDQALPRTKKLAISAHQDDIEIMAQYGIISSFGKSEFSAVVVTDGAGSPRSGIYENYTDQQMMDVRRMEQKKAAAIGEYASLILLNYPSSTVKDPNQDLVVNDIKELLLEAKPEVVYTHNLADKHDTHVAVALRVLEALRGISDVYKPDKLYGCEVWRSLDWMHDQDKTVFDVSPHPSLRAALLGVFDSQIEGGKRYDLAAMGRQTANATFFASHDTDEMLEASYAMDLTPLIDGGDVFEYVQASIDRFALDVKNRIEKFK